MKYGEFISAYAERHNVSKAEASKIVHNVVDLIGDTLLDGESVSFTGAFTLKPVKRAARVQKNPRTGENVNVPERTAVKLTLGKDP